MIQIVPALLLFLLPLAYSPGPGNMFFAANGARFGFRATLPASVGYHVATWGVTVAIGLGFAGLLEAVPQAMLVLRWAGSGYVLWLAWGLARASGAAQGQARPAGFGDGALLLLLNPKAYVIIALMFSQFLGEAAGWGAVLLIASVFTLNNLVAFSVWTLLGDRIGRLFAARGGANQLFGAILAGVAVWMLLG